MKPANSLRNSDLVCIGSSYSLSEDLHLRYINYSITFLNHIISTRKLIIDRSRTTKN